MGYRWCAGKGLSSSCPQSTTSSTQHPWESRRRAAGCGGSSALAFPSAGNEAPAVKEALKKGGMEARQDHGKL